MFSCETFFDHYHDIFNEFKHKLIADGQSHFLDTLRGQVYIKCYQTVGFYATETEKSQASLEEEKKQLFYRHEVTKEYVAEFPSSNVKEGWSVYGPMLEVEINNLKECQEE